MSVFSLSKPKKMHDILDFHYENDPNAVSVSFNSVNYSNKTIYNNVDSLIQKLKNSGLVSGDRVAILSKNNVAFIELLYASSKYGLVLVPLNFRLAYPEINFILSDSGSKVLFYEPEFEGIVKQLEKDKLSLTGLIKIGFDGKYVGFNESQSSSKAINFSESKNVPLFQMYTSGTTGRPKGALISHSGILSLIEHGKDRLGPFKDHANSLVCMPLFHIAGSAWLFFGLASSCNNILLVDINPKEILSILEKSKVTSTLMVPAVVQMVTIEAESRGLKLNNVENIVFGASPMPVDILKRAQKIFPKANFTHVYGMTETTGMFMSLDPIELKNGRRLESCGTCFENSKIKIVDKDNNELPSNEIGEIICKTDQIMDGYFNRENSTEDAIRDGWFYTGDAGYIDEDGFLFIRDRIKDVVISGGENIYPAEVENELMAHSSIVDCAVIGVPDDKWGEAVLAVIVIASSEFSEIDVKAFLKSRLAGFKIPKEFKIVDALPRNAAGKVTKAQLRERFCD